MSDKSVKRDTMKSIGVHRIHAQCTNQGQLILFHTFFSTSDILQDFATRAKVAVQKLIQRVGFFGILACASVSPITLTIYFHIHKKNTFKQI